MKENFQNPKSVGFVGSNMLTSDGGGGPVAAAWFHRWQKRYIDLQIICIDL